MSPSFSADPSNSNEIHLLHRSTPNPPKHSTSPADGSLLSPYSVYQRPYAHSESPVTSFTSPADLNSDGDFTEYTDFNNPDDQFFGVDFDATQGLTDADITTSHIITSPSVNTETSTHQAQLNPTLSAGSSTNDYLSTSPQASSRDAVNDNIAFQQLHRSQQPNLVGNVSPSYPLSVNLPLSTPSVQQPLDPLEDSYAASEANTNSRMTYLGQSPSLTITPWESQVQRDVDANQLGQFKNRISIGNGHNLEEPAGLYAIGPVTNPRQESVTIDDLHKMRRGLDPEARKGISEEKVLSLKEREEQEHLEATNNRVEEWRSSTNGDNSMRPRARSTSALHRQNPHTTLGRTSSTGSDEGNRLSGGVPDSITENRLQEGLYFNLDAKGLTDADRRIAMQSRHWSDTATYRDVMNTRSQPESSNEAIKKFHEMADNYSLLSRTATWGTQRRTEPNTTDIELVTNLFTQVAISKSKERRPGLLEQVSNLVRRKSDGGKLKRKPDDRDNTFVKPAERGRESQSMTLAVPSRSPNSNRSRPASPRLDTSVGTTYMQPHVRNGSLSASNVTSPKNPLSIIGSLRRSRSKSELQGGIAQMWQSESGGPPVAALAQTSLLTEPAVEADSIKLENSDLDLDDEDEDEGLDDVDKMDFDPSALPITPNFHGFQEHVKRLNPKMEPGYLVDRVAHQQVVRYKSLLAACVSHQVAIQGSNCMSGSQCVALGGSATLFDSSGEPRNSSLADGVLQPDFSDGESNPEGALAPETFPSGVPMPPCSTLPAQFECPLCFKVKKFQKPSDWTKHVHEDVQPFTCTYANCREPKSFKRKADWVRHENERHRHLEWWTCKVDDCSHKCFRKDNFLQHLVREHKLPEPKLKTKAAVKKARGGPDEQAWIMVRDCHHDTHARPQDEPCKFCGKTLATWKKLTVHLAKHMEHISLPVLELVKKQTVDANTIISPVDPLPPSRQTPLPVSATYLEERRLSDSSVPIYGNIGTTLSPGVPPVHFSSPYGQTASELQGMHRYSPDARFGEPLAFSHTGPNQNVYTAAHPHHDMLFSTRQLGFTNFDQEAVNMDLTSQSSPFHSLRHSPLLDQSQQFDNNNSHNYNAAVPHAYHSQPGSHHTLSPDPPGFLSGSNQAGFHGHSIDPDDFTTAPEDLAGYTARQNQAFAVTSSPYEFAPNIINNQNYGHMQGLGLSAPNQIPYTIQPTSLDPQQPPSYPPAPQGSYNNIY